MIDKAFYISIGSAAFFLIGGLALGGALGSGTARSFFKSSPRLAIVDMQALIAKGSQHLAKTIPNKALGKASKVSGHQIREAGEQLKETLEAFAAKHHLILFSKGAVMGGNLPDYTAEIMEEAFPDYTPIRLLAFIENKTGSQQSKSSQSEDFWFEGLQPKGERPGGQENQP